MLMRLVEATLKPGTLEEFESIYRREILPVLEETPGCRFAGLLKSVDESNRLVSLTLWENKERVRSYVDSGLFQKNLDRAEPYLQESAEWKIQLTKEDTLDYQPVKQEPVIKSYPVTAESETVPEEMAARRNYLRVLSLKVKPGKQEEFKQIYSDEIQPELQNVAGCRYAFLVDSSEHDREMLSFTIWSDLEAVERYEKEGKYKALLGRVEDTLAELYQWKMALENRPGTAESVSSEDIDISKYTLVTGKKFK